MKIIYLSILITIISFSLSNSFFDDDDIRLTAIIFRHGARTPYYYDDYERNLDSLGHIWSLGVHELTDVGKSQLYSFGNKVLFEMIKRRQIRDKNEILAFSTNKPRAIQSLESFLKGLFLTQNNPVPFEILDTKKDKYYYLSSECAGFPDYLKEDNSSIFKNIIKLNDKWGKEIKENFKIEINTVKPVESRVKLYNLADTFISNYYNKNDLSNYLSVDQQNLFILDIESYFSDDMFKGTYCEENNGVFVALASKTKFFKDLFAYFDDRIKMNNKTYSKEQPKLLIFSAHDHDITETVIFLNKALNVKFNSPVIFASAITIDLIFDKTYIVDINIMGNEYYRGNYEFFKTKVEQFMVPIAKIDEFCGFDTK